MENQVRAIARTMALQVFMFNVDTANPILLSFNFDANASQLVLSFDEFINVTTLNVTGLALQDDMSKRKQ